MSDVNSILEELKERGSETTKRTLMKHGAREPFYGVKIEDLKKIQKRIKNNQELALELYDTGISDAMYLAGLTADGSKMTREQLRSWAENAYWYMLSEYTVAWVVAEHPEGWDIAIEWIESDEEKIAVSGWSALTNIISVKPDKELDLSQIKKLLQRIAKGIHDAPNRVRYVMNGFVIAVGCFVQLLTEEAMKVAEKVGKVHVEMGGTACKVPLATDYINKVKDKGRLGQKRKMIKC